MLWILGLAVIFALVAVAAVVTERRRSSLGGDAREDRFINPTRDRYKSLADKEQEHPDHGTAG
jgi:hypothetical protein